MRSATPSVSPDRGLLAFAAAVFVFHQTPAFAGHTAGDAIDLLTPVAVIAASAAVLGAYGMPRAAVMAALVAAGLYVHGHGIHLAANSIHNEDPTDSALDVTYFWDERFSHIESLLGWLGLLASFCLAESRAGVREREPAVARIAVALLGFTFFTSTVEGQTWPLELVAAAAFAYWAWRARPHRPLLTHAAVALAFAALLIAVWAVWHGGVPEFSDTGVI